MRILHFQTEFQKTYLIAIKKNESDIPTDSYKSHY